MWSAFEPLIVFIGIAILVKVISDSILKSKLINRGIVDENVKYIFSSYNKDRKRTDLKWGMVLLGIGISIIIYQFSDIHEEMMIGLMFLFAGIAFITYHIFGKNGDNNDNSGSNNNMSNNITS